MSKINYNISNWGTVMGASVGLASVECEGTYEHLAIGSPQEGYTLVYKDPSGNEHVSYDVDNDVSGIIRGSNQVFPSSDAFVKVTESQTNPNQLSVRQTFIVPHNSTRIVIRMEVTNNGGANGQDVSDLLIKRYADIDVDTGGTLGWAGFLGRWEKTRYSVFTYNLDSDIPLSATPRRHNHVVNMVAMPSDLPLDDAFVGKFGAWQYKQRANNSPVVADGNARIDAIGVLQWHATKLRVGETVRLNLYYDAFRGFCRRGNGPVVGTTDPILVTDEPPIG